MTKTKIALAAVLFAATTSAAFAGFYDPNLANRYPSYADPNTYGYSASGSLGSLQSAPAGALHSAQVRLQKHSESQSRLQQRDAALPTGGEQTPQAGPFWYSWSGPTAGGM